MTEAPTGSGKVTLRPFKVGGCSFEPGDQYDPSISSLDARQNDRLVHQGYIVDFAPEAYRLAISKRPPGTVGRGWSLELLYSTGALERPPADKLPSGGFVPKEGDEVHLGYHLSIRKMGNNFRYVTVYAPSGGRMAEREFKSPAKAREFIETLPVLPIDVHAGNYDDLLAEVSGLMNAPAGTPSYIRLQALAAAIEAYEDAQTSPDSAGSANQGNEPEVSQDDRDVQRRSIK